MTRVYTRKPLADRFWAKVDLNGPMCARLGSRCWLWTAKAHHDFGYGMITVVDGVTIGAHRAAWIVTHGPIALGVVIRHACDNPPCCNPDHLLAGTQRDNNADRDARGRHARGAKCIPKKHMNGSAGPFSKLTAADVLVIRARRSAGETLGSLGAEFRVTKQTIAAIEKRKNWRHI